MQRMVIAGALLLAAIETAPATEPERRWVRREDGLANSLDWARAILAVPGGPIVVTGIIRNDSDLAHHSDDCLTVAYDPQSGGDVWRSVYAQAGHDECVALATSGPDVYVAGSSTASTGFSQFLVLKYVGGALEWARSFESAELGGYGNASVADAAVGTDGFLRVTGRGGNANLAYGYDYVTLTIGPDGTLEGLSRYVGFEHPWGDTPASIAVDDEGNVLVTGSSPGSDGDNDYLTLKYDSSGAELWAARYDGPGNGEDDATSVLLDWQGRVLVTGDSPNERGDSDFATLKYDDSGNVVWVRRFDGPAKSGDGGQALAVDPQGDIYVAGATHSTNRFNMATLRYTAGGELVWARVFALPDSKTLSLAVAAVDSRGEVVVASGGFGSDYAAVKYTAGGQLVWQATYDGPAKNSDWPFGLALDSDDSVYLTGYSYSASGGFDWATLKYDFGRRNPPPLSAPRGLTAVTLSQTAIALRWTDTSTGESEFRIEAKNAQGTFAELGSAIANSSGADVEGLNPASTYTFRIRSINTFRSSDYSNSATATTAGGPAVCVHDEQTACLFDGRFSVTSSMKDFSHPPLEFPSRVMRFDGGRAESDQAAFFESFELGNLEIAVKMVDACGLPVDHVLRSYWVFVGGLTNASARVVITDTATSEAFEWTNSADQFPTTIGNTRAFPCDSSRAASACTRDPETACLLGGRFRVTTTMFDFSAPPKLFPGRVMWFPSGRAETEQAVFLESFNPGNFELGVKMLNGCGLPANHPLRAYWIFYGGLTNAEADVLVVQVATGAVDRWQNVSGEFPTSEGRTRAFPCEE